MIYLNQADIPLDTWKRYGNTPIDDCLLSGEIASNHINTEVFEQKLSQYLGVDRTVAVNSGTAALHLALLAHNIGRGDRVVLPVTTFVGTVNAVMYTGATPVFADVDPETWLITPETMPELTQTVKAIIPVHLYGSVCNIHGIKRFKKIIIEDCAEALGAQHEDAKVGTMGDVSCFSFNGNKIITTGGGGLIRASSNTDWYIKTSRQSDIDEWLYDGVGYNYRMPALNAALGLIQIDNLDKYVAQKQRINAIYREELPEIKFQGATPDCIPSWWYTAGIFPDGINIPEFQAKLQGKGIPTRRVFRPLTHSKPFAVKKKFSVAEMLWKRGLCLPSSVKNSSNDVYKICETIKEEIGR